MGCECRWNVIHWLLFRMNGNFWLENFNDAKNALQNLLEPEQGISMGQYRICVITIHWNKGPSAIGIDSHRHITYM